VLCLGAAYKKDIDDMRESPSLRVITLLKGTGAEVDYHDPYVPELHAGHGFNFDMKSVPLSAETLAAYDAVVILTDHSNIDYNDVVKHSNIVIDTRNACKNVGPGREKVTKA
jgi:UDP-N-acetyl-D-glucosamine dehydrogenase